MSRPAMRVLAVTTAMTLMAFVPAATVTADSPVDDAIETHRHSTTVAVGVTLDSFDRWTADGWLQADALTVDLTSDVTIDYAHPGAVASSAPISEQIEAYPDAVAAINGDFFDINNTDAPMGVGIQDSQLVTSPTAGRNNAVGITPDGVGEILQVDFAGTVTLPSGEYDLEALNSSRLPVGAIGQYTALWGAAERDRVVGGSEDVFEVVVSDGVVTEVSSTLGKGPIDGGSFVLVGREAGAAVLSQVQVGDRVTAEYSAVTDEDRPLRTAIGGNQLLIVDGQIQEHPDDGFAPRTAVGFSADGSIMYLLAVDGRQAGAEGVTVNDMAELMAELGAHNALNLDGGGSTTMMARHPGDEEPIVVNSPSDGEERAVANGLVISAPPGSGRPAGYDVSPAMDPMSAPGVAPMPGGSPDRVFPGLTRQLSHGAHDETYGPAEADPWWLSFNPFVGTVDRDGVFTARNSGTTRVNAFDFAASGHVDLTVLGPLERIESTGGRVGLADESATARFGVVGYDSAGFSAPIDPVDAQLEYDPDLLTITPGPETFEVRANTAEAATLVTVEVAGRETVVPVTVGLSREPVTGFEDAADWRFSAARADGSLTAVEGRTGDALAMTYDFTQDTATRAAYAQPPEPIAVPGQPQSFSVWINGSGDGEWPTLHFSDGTGADLLLRSDYVTWEGWREVIFDVPEGTTYPLTLKRVYVAEVDATASYHGEVAFDDLVAAVPPDVEAPEAPVMVDPTYASSVSDSDWRFAVMSDAQFVAAAPDSDIVASARRTLAEIKATAPEFVIINGDLVDEGSVADLEFARQVITEELGDDLPWYYVPGNHEVMGGQIGNFIDEFGDAYRTFDHNGTRFITLDTSSLNIRGGGFDQMTMLRDQLDAAATDRSVDSVVVVQHVPPRDPLPQAGSQLTDRKDAHIIEQWLSDFAVDTGKGIGFIGSHVGVFHATQVDGVPYVINGNAGKNPAAGPEAGGFIGWTEFGVDSISTIERVLRQLFPYGHGPQDWLRATTHVQLDAVAMTAPSTIAVGEETRVDAMITQQGEQLPLVYPMGSDWSESTNVWIGDRAPEDGDHAAWFDPATGRLTGLSPGEFVLTVTVNGVTETVQITVDR